MTQRYSHCCLCLDSISIICSCLCHAASVVSVPAMPLAPAEGGWTPPRAPPPPPPYSITAAAPYSALSLLPSAVLRRSQHGAGPLDAARPLSIFPSSFLSFLLFLSFSLFLFYFFSTLRFTVYTPVRLLPGDSYGISARSVSARWTSPLLERETPAIRTREHRNNVQTTVTQCILSFSSTVAASPPSSSSFSSSASTSFPPLDDSASLLQEEHLKSSLVRGYSRTYRSSLLSGQGASLLLSYEK